LEFFFVSDAVVGTEEIMMKELVKTPCPWVYILVEDASLCVLMENDLCDLLLHEKSKFQAPR
jgi:hypothetical protein